MAGGNSVIAVHTSGNGLRFYWNEYGTNNWHGEQVAANGTTFSDPAIAQVGNTVVIAADGPSNSLDFYWAINGTSTWHPEVVAGAGTIATAPAISAHDNGVTIVALNQGGYLSTSWWATNGTAGWVRPPCRTETAAPHRSRRTRAEFTS